MGVPPGHQIQQVDLQKFHEVTAYQAEFSADCYNLLTLFKRYTYVCSWQLDFFKMY